MAVRRLYIPGQPARIVTVRIGIPRRLRRGWDWGCPVELGGLKGSRLRYVFGVDAFQAIHLALEYIAIRISAATPRPYWIEAADGGGFTRAIPGVLPLAIQAQLQGMIDRAVKRWANKGKRAAMRTRRTRP